MCIIASIAFVKFMVLPTEIFSYFINFMIISLNRFLYYCAIQND